MVSFADVEDYLFDKFAQTRNVGLWGDVERGKISRRFKLGQINIKFEWCKRRGHWLGRFGGGWNIEFGF